MTAKEALREIVDEMSEEQAETWLRSIDLETTDALMTELARLTADELMQLPANLRGVILRIAARQYTADDAAEDVKNWADWEAGTGKDIHLVDA